MGCQEEWGAERLVPKSWYEGVMNGGIYHQDRAHRVDGRGTGFWEDAEFSFGQAEFKVPEERVLCLVAQSCPTLCNPIDCSLQGSSVHGDSPGRSTVVDCHALLQGIFLPLGSKPRSPTLQADSLLSEPPGKPTWRISSGTILKESDLLQIDLRRLDILCMIMVLWLFFKVCIFCRK